MSNLDSWLERGEQAIVDVLDDQLAVVAPELMARICEPRAAYGRDIIQPHIVGMALQGLDTVGIVESHTTATRGSRTITTYQLAGTTRRKTATERAAARKRLLYGRYLSWTTPTVQHPSGVIGPATEAAAVEGIRAASVVQVPYGTDGRELRHVLGVDLGGPVDYVGYVVAESASSLGVPIVLLVEVKANRGWLYPSSAELFQPLMRGLSFNEAQPSERCVPMLVTRRVHPEVFPLAQRLGFMAIPLDAQFLGDATAQRLVDEVKSELTFRDLQTGPLLSLRVRDYFRRPTFRRALPMAAERWRRTCGSVVAADAIRRGYRNRRSLIERERASTDLRLYATRTGADE